MGLSRQLLGSETAPTSLTRQALVNTVIAAAESLAEIDFYGDDVFGDGTVLTFDVQHSVGVDRRPP